MTKSYGPSRVLNKGRMRVDSAEATSLREKPRIAEAPNLLGRAAKHSLQSRGKRRANHRMSSSCPQPPMGETLARLGASVRPPQHTVLQEQRTLQKASSHPSNKADIAALPEWHPAKVPLSVSLSRGRNETAQQPYQHPTSTPTRVATAVNRQLRLILLRNPRRPAY